MDWKQIAVVTAGLLATVMSGITLWTIRRNKKRLEEVGEELKRFEGFIINKVDSVLIELCQKIEQASARPPAGNKPADERIPVIDYHLGEIGGNSRKKKKKKKKKKKAGKN